MFAIMPFFFIMLFFPWTMQAKEAIHDIKAKKSSLVDSFRIKPQDLLVVIEDQLKALRAKKIEEAYNNYTSTQFREETSLEAFKKKVAQFPALSNNKLFQFQSFYTENDIASFGGDLLSVNGESLGVEYDLVLENSQWKIIGIQIYQNELSLPLTEKI